MAEKRHLDATMIDDHPGTKRNRPTDDINTEHCYSNPIESDKLTNARNLYKSPAIAGEFEKETEVLSEKPGRENVISGLPDVIEIDDDDGSERIEEGDSHIDDSNNALQQPKGNSGFEVFVSEPKSRAESSAGSADSNAHAQLLPGAPSTSSSSKAELVMTQKTATISEKNFGPATSSGSNLSAGPEEGDIVRILSASECRSRNIEDFAVSVGRPTPILRSSDTITDHKSGIKISLSKYTYEKISWLTGSKSTGKYCCWPCLLFSPKEKWSCPGDIGWKESSVAILNHQMTPGHVKAFKTLKEREKLLADPTNLLLASQRIPDKNSTHRRFFELLIRLLCSKKTKFQNTGDLDFEGYEEMMKLIISHDPELTAYYKKQFSKHSLVEFVSFHAAKLLTSIVHVIKSSIKKDIISTPYLSIVYEGADNIVDRVSFVAVFIRYVDDGGEIRERFLKFVKLSGIRTSENIYEIHESLLNEFGLQDKLIGFSYSGTVVVPSGIVALNNTIRILSPKSRYFHCPDHNLKEILLQSLSHVEQCGEFLYSLNNLELFFSSNSGAIPTLVNFVKTRDPTCPWLYKAHSFTHDLISTIKYSYPLVLQFFDRVLKKFWNDEVVRHAPEFIRFLTKHKTKFLIGLVPAVLNCVHHLSSLMERSVEPHIYKQAALSALKQLQSLKKSGAEPFMRTVSDPKLCMSNSKVIQPMLSVNECNGLFHSIIDTAINCVSHRCFLDTFFVGNPSQGFADVVKNETVMSRYAAATCGTEIAALNEQIDSFKAYELMFHKKTLAEHVAHMVSLKMTEDFSELYRFLHFSILVAPPKPGSIITKFKAYAKDKQKFSTSEVFLYLEKDTVSQMTKSNQFSDDVINHYAKYNNVAIAP